jgi:hypothetical protein
MLRLVVWAVKRPSPAVDSISMKTAFGGGVLVSSMIQLFLIHPMAAISLTPVIVGVIVFKRANVCGGMHIALNEMFKRFTKVVT